MEGTEYSLKNSTYIIIFSSFKFTGIFEDILVLFVRTIVLMATSLVVSGDKAVTSSAHGDQEAKLCQLGCLWVCHLEICGQLLQGFLQAPVLPAKQSHHPRILLSELVLLHLLPILVNQHLQCRVNIIYLVFIIISRINEIHLPEIEHFYSHKICHIEQKKYCQLFNSHNLFCKKFI